MKKIRAIHNSGHTLSTDPYAWSAVDDDTYDGAEDSSNRHMIGYGATREEAIADLERLLREEEEWKTDLHVGDHVYHLATHEQAHVVAFHAEDTDKVFITYGDLPQRYLVWASHLEVVR